MAMDKTFQPKEAEARISKAWIDGGHFRAGAGARRPETFSVLIPPPNVTGSLHIGHAFNNTLQDILVRWHRMRGFDTLWQAGTDHAGIATQMVVEREMAKEGNVRRQDMSREDFVARVWAQKAKSGDRIVEQLRRLGASCDWDRLAFTMSGAPGAPEGEGGNFHDAVIKVFCDLYDKGLIYRGKRLVNWDPHFETAISDLEVESREVAGHMWHFRYPLAGGETYDYVERDAEGEVLFTEERDWISIATTRPETMLGDGAVAVHPSDARYTAIVGKLCEIPVGPKESRRLIPIITDEYPDPAFGSGAVKITGAHDFNDYAVAKRGGIPCYRLMDTRGALRADGAPYAEEAAKARAIREGREASEAEVDAINLVPDAYRGLDRFEARARIVADITAERLAVMVPESDPRLGRKSASSDAPPGGQAGDPEDSFEEGGTPIELALVPLVEPKTIQQPHGDRSGVVIEPMLTDQWFVDTAAIVQPAIDAVRNGDVAIVPEGDRKVYFHWLENIEPWCISRQLWWGHRVPVWYAFGFNAECYSKAPQEIQAKVRNDGQYIYVCAATFEEAAVEFRRYYEWVDGVGGYYGSKGLRLFSYADDAVARMKGLLSDDAVSPEDKDVMPAWRDPDVLDTWFSSGLWPIGTLGWPEDTEELRRYYPTSLLVTGQDILFFWVARMMMMQLAVLPDSLPILERIPFQAVYLHGLVRDAKGKKMSKSLGNVVDPLDVIDEYGADALRFTNAAMASLGGALKLDVSRIAGYRNFGTKLWNAVRFAEMYDVQFVKTGSPDLPQNVKNTVNRWILGETASVREAVDAALAAYRFDDAANALYRFVWNVVCDWYVEFSKPVLQGEATDEKRETQAVMGWVLERCMAMLHPFMPFVTEELWRVTGHDGMLVTSPWPEDDAAQAVDAEAQSEIRWVVAFIESIRSARAQMNVPAGAVIPVVAVEWDETARKSFETNENMIATLARIDGLAEGAAPKGSIAVTVHGARFALPLEGVIDVGTERTRLDRSVAKLDKEINGMERRVDNPNFAASAPPEVVEETRMNLAARQAERDAVRAALASLTEIA